MSTHDTYTYEVLYSATTDLELDCSRCFLLAKRAKEGIPKKRGPRVRNSICLLYTSPSPRD